MMAMKFTYKKSASPSPTNRHIEKLLLFISGKVMKAGMTVEATLILPLFLFFIFNLGSVFEMIRLHNNLQLALCDAGKNISVYAFDVGGDILASGVSSVYVKHHLESFLGKDYLEDSPLVKGSNGISLWGSSFLSGDEFGLTVTYKVETPFSVAGVEAFRMMNPYRIHLWNGYEVSEEEQPEEVIVYITETGGVYHTNMNCSYISLTVRDITEDNLTKERNAQGSRYVPCHKCCRGERPETFYVTKSGECYHYTRECPSIKRTVHTISLEEAQDRGYRYCSRCGTS